MSGSVSDRLIDNATRFESLFKLSQGSGNKAILGRLTDRECSWRAPESESRRLQYVWSMAKNLRSEWMMRSRKGERSCSRSSKGMARLVGPFPLGRSKSSALLRSRNGRHFSRQTFLNCFVVIVSGTMVRCFMNPAFRAKRSRDAIKSELSQPISGVRKRMSFVDPVYRLCNAGILHTELTQEQCKRSMGAST